MKKDYKGNPIDTIFPANKVPIARVLVKSEEDCMHWKNIHKEF